MNRPRIDLLDERVGIVPLQGFAWSRFQYPSVHIAKWSMYRGDLSGRTYLLEVIGNYGETRIQVADRLREARARIARHFHRGVFH